MPYRIEKLNSLIKEEVAKIIEKEMEFSRNVLVTITDVDTSIDVTHARIKISVLPDRESKKVLDRLQRKISFIQSLLNRKLILRYVPKISFIIDESAKRIDRFEKIAKDIKNNS